MIDQEAIEELRNILVTDYGQNLDAEKTEVIGRQLLAIAELCVYEKNKNHYETTRLSSYTSI